MRQTTFPVSSGRPAREDCFPVPGLRPLVTGLRKRDAEELLDWLEAHGYLHLRLTVGGGESFAVGWSADRLALPEDVS